MTWRRVALALLCLPLLIVGAEHAWDYRTRSVDGEGVLVHYGMGCIGIDLDGPPGSGDPVILPIGRWPEGLSAYMTDGHVVLDKAGNEVLREGDRIVVHATSVRADGDIPLCSYLTLTTVVSWQRIPAPVGGPTAQPT